MCQIGTALRHKVNATHARWTGWATLSEWQQDDWANSTNSIFVVLQWTQFMIIIWLSPIRRGARRNNKLAFMESFHSQPATATNTRRQEKCGRISSHKGSLSPLSLFRSRSRSRSRPTIAVSLRSISGASLFTGLQYLFAWYVVHTLAKNCVRVRMMIRSSPGGMRIVRVSLLFLQTFESNFAQMYLGKCDWVRQGKWNWNAGCEKSNPFRLFFTSLWFVPFSPFVCVWHTVCTCFCICTCFRVGGDDDDVYAIRVLVMPV